MPEAANGSSSPSILGTPLLALAGTAPARVNVPKRLLGQIPRTVGVSVTGLLKNAWPGGPRVVPWGRLSIEGLGVIDVPLSSERLTLLNMLELLDIHITRVGSVEGGSKSSVGPGPEYKTFSSLMSALALPVFDAGFESMARVLGALHPLFNLAPGHAHSTTGQSLQREGFGFFYSVSANHNQCSTVYDGKMWIPYSVALSDIVSFIENIGRPPIFTEEWVNKAPTRVFAFGAERALYVPFSSEKDSSSMATITTSGVKSHTNTGESLVPFVGGSVWRQESLILSPCCRHSIDEFNARMQKTLEDPPWFRDFTLSLETTLDQALSSKEVDVVRSACQYKDAMPVKFVRSASPGKDLLGELIYMNGRQRLVTVSSSWTKTEFIGALATTGRFPDNTPSTQTR